MERASPPNKPLQLTLGPSTVFVGTTAAAASSVAELGRLASMRKRSKRTQVRYTSSCHCGAVTVEMERKLRKMTQCNCTICRRYGALWAYFQRKSIHVHARANGLKAYSWGDRRLEFFHCSECGCVTHYERTDKREDGSDMAAVNIRNIDDPASVANVPIRLLDGALTWRVLHQCSQPYLLRSPGRTERHDQD